MLRRKTCLLFAIFQKYLFEKSSKGFEKWDEGKSFIENWLFQMFFLFFSSICPFGII